MTNTPTPSMIKTISFGLSVFEVREIVEDSGPPGVIMRLATPTHEDMERLDALGGKLPLPLSCRCCEVVEMWVGATIDQGVDVSVRFLGTPKNDH